MYPPERELWEHLCLRRCSGHRFRRQHPIGVFIADFICLERKLIIEVDGDHHGLPEQEAHDAHRTAWLTSRGYRVHRIWASDVFGCLDFVLLEIEQLLATPPS